MSAYWSQWSAVELISLHGIELEDAPNDNNDLDSEEETTKDQEEFYMNNIESEMSLYMISQSDFF